MPDIVLVTGNKIINETNTLLLLMRLFFFFSFFLFFRAISVAYGGSQVRGQIRAIAARLYHSHSNTGSEPHLQPTPQLMAMPDP